MAERKPTPMRQQRRTVLMVGEGFADCDFLRHLKTLYVGRSSNKTVTIKNARGKGGRHVLKTALDEVKHKGAAYDVVAVLLDTDTDWDDALRAKARKSKVTVFESTPCLEAELLRIADHRAPEVSAQCKREFAQRFGHEAHDPDVWPEHFQKALLDQAKNRVPVLANLLALLTS